MRSRRLTLPRRRNLARAQRLQAGASVPPSRLIHYRRMKDPHATLRDQVLKRALDGAGEADTALRNAAADRKGVPPELQPLIDKIHDHAYKVTDEDLAQLQKKYNDDQLFEIVVSAALGASRKRLLAGLAALENTKDRP